MRIPEVRERLRQIADTVPEYHDELNYLADELTRRPVVRSGRAHQKMTPEIANKIKAMAQADPTLPGAVIARALSISQGRVSEVLRGFRT